MRPVLSFPVAQVLPNLQPVCNRSKPCHQVNWCPRLLPKQLFSFGIGLRGIAGGPQLIHKFFFPEPGPRPKTTARDRRARSSYTGVIPFLWFGAPVLASPRAGWQAPDRWAGCRHPTPRSLPLRIRTLQYLWAQTSSVATRSAAADADTATDDEQRATRPAPCIRTDGKALLSRQTAQRAVRRASFRFISSSASPARPT